MQTAKPELRLKTALDELRMQMLGAQVLFGFQFNSGFQTESDRLSPAARYLDIAGLVLMVLAIAIVIAVPCQHRLVERGETSERIYRVAANYAGLALFPIALALACDVFLVSDFLFAPAWACVAAVAMLSASLVAWYGPIVFLRRQTQTGQTAMAEKPTPLHAKIEQMLTEARVVLPGAQALLGFQFIAVLTRAFAELPRYAQLTHFAALCATAVAIVLLITPAAIHRVAFDGADNARFHRIGSALITIALLPMAFGIAGDVFVATLKLLGEPALAWSAAAGSLVTLLGLWYVLPLALRFRQHLAAP